MGNSIVGIVPDPDHEINLPLRYGANAVRHQLIK